MTSMTTKMIVTFLGVGYSPICPGTIASIVTLPLWFLIMSIINHFNIKIPSIPIILTIVIIYIVSYSYTKKYVTENNLDDPSEVVIDEVVGQLLSFFVSLFFTFFIKNIDLQAVMLENRTLFCLLLIVLPITLFRLFDITKPWIIGKIDSNMKNAHGIMLDDVVAGIFAGILNNVITVFIVKFFIL